MTHPNQAVDLGERIKARAKQIASERGVPFEVAARIADDEFLLATANRIGGADDDESSQQED